MTPEGWARTTLGKTIREPIRNGYSPNCPPEPNGRWILSLGAVTPDGFNVRGVKPAPVGDVKVDGFLLECDDIVVSRSNTRERVGLAGQYKGVPEPCAYPDLLMRVRCNDSVIPDFLTFVLLSKEGRDYFERSARGTSGSMVKIDKPLLEAFPLLLPPLPEQRKIAAILSSVDEAIEATQAVIDQLQVVKKAMIAELLTRGIPARHTKFKMTEIGEVPEGWEVVPLLAVCEFLDGRRVPIKSSDREAMRGKYPYYGASGIIDWVNDFIFDEPLVLLAEDGANILTRSTAVAFKVEGKCWVNNHAHVLRVGAGKDPDFLIEYLESLEYEQFSTGTAQPKLNQAVCQRIPVACPPAQEQAQIGRVARLFAERLATEAEQLTGLRTLKSALMSVLLTGEVRVQPDGEAA